MNRFIRTHIRRRPAVVCMALGAMLLMTAGSAQAATTVYPAGGSGFNSSAEGWSPGSSSCAPLALLCTPEPVYDPTAGNPPGSISARTTVTLNLLSLFKGTETWNSPQFTVPVGAVTGASVRLDRAFSPGGLINVGPTGNYSVILRDLTSGTSSTPLTESVTGADGTFAARGAAASVVSGHTYQLSIEATTAQSTLALSLLSGVTDLRFDNVGLVVQTAGDEGGASGADGNNGSNGAGGLTDAQLSSLIQSSLTGPAVLSGKRLSVKAKCPAAVGGTCRVSVPGLLKKGSAATTTRTSKVAKGKAKTLVLKVKPKAKGKLAKRSSLLFKETVRAGGAKATVYKTLKLIRRR